MNVAGFISALKDWQGRIDGVQIRHYSQASRLERLHYCIGLPSTILAAIAGTTVFVRLEEATNRSVQVAVGVVAVTSAVLTAVMTFFSHAKRAEQSRSVSAQLGEVRRRIDILIQFPPSSQSEMRKVLEGLNNQIAAIDKGAPLIAFSKSDNDNGGGGGGGGGGGMRLLSGHP